MKIYVNGSLAVIKKGTSFDYVLENRYFTGSDAYTMAITFPISGCYQNMRIFGKISRKDIEDKVLLYDCEIADTHFNKKGSLTVTDINEVEIKCQFLEGRSVENYYSTFDDIYINELDLGAPFSVIKADYDIMDMWDNTDYLALPWCNNSSGNIQNALYIDMDMDIGSSSEVVRLKWKNEVEKLSFQPNLHYIFKKICAALGYSSNTYPWVQSGFNNLYICNAVPAAWEHPEWNFILPHWSVTQFLEELEKLMNCEFDINHATKHIEMKFAKNIIESKRAYDISASVINKFSVDVTETDESEYSEARALKYSDRDDITWKYNSAAFMESYNNINIEEFDKAEDIIDIISPYIWMDSFMPQNAWVAKLFKENMKNTFFGRKEMFTWFQEASVGSNWQSISKLIPVGNFAVRDSENESNIDEINIVPCWTDDVMETYSLGGYSYDMFNEIIFLECGTLEDPNPQRTDEERLTPLEELVIKEGEKEAAAVFDKIYVGFWWPGVIEKFVLKHNTINPKTIHYPRPITDFCTYVPRGPYLPLGGFFYTEYSLRIDSTGNRKITNIRINTKEKYTYSFISKEIPDVRCIFYIHGKRYLCKKITTSFSDHGMSEKMKGEFYQIQE